MTLTPESERKLHVLTLLEGKRIAMGQAAEALGLTCHPQILHPLGLPC